MPPSRTATHSDGPTRRAWLQAGLSSSLGLGLASLPGRSAAAVTRAGKAKSVILVWLTGAASHIDTFDPKPDAPAGIRGEFGTIATKVPGFRVGEHLPRLAARADRYAVVRSMSHRDTNPLKSTPHL